MAYKLNSEKWKIIVNYFYFCDLTCYYPVQTSKVSLSTLFCYFSYIISFTLPITLSKLIATILVIGDE